MFRDNLCPLAGELAALQPGSVRQLVAAKRLPDAYVLGHLALASDGTGIYASSAPHCAKCLVPLVKEEFPRQPFVHLLDSLYANGPALKRIDGAGHRFICNFKRGSIPTLYDDATALLGLVPGNVLRQQTALPGVKGRQVRHVRRVFRWATPPLSAAAPRKPLPAPTPKSQHVILQRCSVPPVR